MLDGGTFSIVSGHDGVQAQTSLTIGGGTFELHTGGGAASATQAQTYGFAGGMTPPGGDMLQPGTAFFIFCFVNWSFVIIKK